MTGIKKHHDAQSPAGPMIHRMTLLALTVYWGILFVGTHVPLADHGGIRLGDKLLHFLAYSGLGFLLAWATMRLRPSVTATLWVLGVVFVYGMVDELTQAFVPSRSAEAGDWLADALGGTVGVASYYAVQWLRLYWLSAAGPVTDPN
jgi:VanZ family protein